MSSAYFVDPHSVVRQIWGKADTILFIFAGASAEFALSKAVDWLYFTGRLPADPLARLFSTVAFARTIVFSERASALRAIDAMASIHAQVEAKRGIRIPDWAYRDVLFMLIDYSIRSYERLERKLSRAEKEDVFQVFHQVGRRMGVPGLPDDFDTWATMRQQHLHQNLQGSPYTEDLFRQYKKSVGRMRYWFLRETQTLLVPQHVRALLGFRDYAFISPLLDFYKWSRHLKLDVVVKALFLPRQYQTEIKGLDSMTAHDPTMGFHKEH
ncbi:hypothetical protein SAMN05421823_11823 [Catalinimonas alkaloidigena]|uniref:ER-bound oxygenase mpaB/mpaB'/Rubber oxygenase catalytic domain-containing protein n=1 Tax=Catalinimonas alkaloidigena TaxID=1075417 RepID=A0A1G9UX52_9BACT|nr:oxygenase MpaB family protein [Catalinimonas alkaloidigena]SDM64502.1 hypothetical protein SAMN05421823_11823 [Catalinimonas alkaloidigena]